MNADSNTSAIDRLEQALAAVTTAALAKFDVSDLSGLDAEMPALRALARSGSGLEAQEDDRIDAAVRSYRQTGRVDGIAQARLLCYGCTRVVDSKRLIEEPAPLAALLEHVDGLHFHPRTFRRCYRGLLDAYFSYDPDTDPASEEGRRGSRNLRVFLNRGKNWIETPGSDPEWVPALLENRNLLTDDPVSRFGMAALMQGSAAFDAIRARLDVPEDSWLVRRLVLAQVDAALGLADQHFKSVVVRLLVQLAKHPAIRHVGLCKVIDRYAASGTREVHARLRDFAVMHWGDPRVAPSSAAWARVRPSAREMVAGWLR